PMGNASSQRFAGCRYQSVKGEEGGGALPEKTNARSFVRVAGAAREKRSESAFGFVPAIAPAFISSWRPAARGGQMAKAPIANASAKSLQLIIKTGFKFLRCSFIAPNTHFAHSR